MTPRGRAVRPLLPLSIVALSLLVAPSAPASPPSFDDLLAELSPAVMNILTANEPVRVVAAGAEPSVCARSLSAALGRLGVRTVDTPDAGTLIVCSCTVTIRERLCLADVRKADTNQLVTVQRLREDSTTPPLAAPVVIELTPVVSQPTPILDIAATGARLLVLGPESVTRYDRTDQGWRVREARPIAVSLVWPRDLRGRLIATATSFEAYLPGVVCRGTMDPFALSCVEQQAAWPIGADNQGIVPARNFFSRANGFTYYSMAPLDPDAGARWLAASREGHLVMLDAAGAPIAPADAEGDDVVRVSTGCAAGTHVLSSAQGSDPETGALRLFRVAGRQLTLAAPPAMLPGSLTALWPASEATTSTAVAHNPATGGYEAFQVRVSCGR